MRAPLILTCFLLVGCSSEIAATDDTSASAITGCTPLTPGLVITKSARLCSDTRKVAVEPGAAALTVAGDDITLTCEGGLLLDNASGFGSDNEAPRVGIRVDGGHRVRIEGCSARNFRYGLVASGTKDLTITNGHFDDNFRDEAREWVQDTVQGGGVRLEGVEDAVVDHVSFARNWNGIELRHTKRAKVTAGDGSHASNWGAFVDHSEDCEIADGNFDWGIRWGRARAVADIPLEQRDRTNWFGQDTKDSGGIVVDGGSQRTRILRNSVRYGGDGIFVRAITGSCPKDTYVEGNDVSFSPHFALETWCDGDRYVSNTSTDSDNGIWFGGGSNIVATGNRIEKSRVYALSIMENQGRHIVVENNVFAHNRAGIMVSGRNRWPGQSMDSASWPNMANSSHIVIQRNLFEDNELADIAASFTRALTIASNCAGTSDVEPALGPETQGVRTIGHCSPASSAPPADATVSAPGVTHLGEEAMFAASAAGASSFSWLVQPANHRFPSGQLPPALLSATSDAPSARIVFDVPGLFDVDVTADNGALASLAYTQVAVPPEGTRLGEATTDWTYDCHGECTTVVREAKGLDEGAVRLETNASSRFSAIVAAHGLPIAPVKKLAFFLRAENPKVWQHSFPTVRVSGPDGTVTFVNQVLDSQRPAAGNVLKFGEAGWIYVEIPFAGGNGFTRSGTVPSTVDTIAIETETTHDPLALTIDDLTLF